MNRQFYSDAINALRTSHGRAAVVIGSVRIPIAVSNVNVEESLCSHRPDITFEAYVLHDADSIANTKQLCNMAYGYQHGIKKVIFNDPATIVLWNDGTKTVVKCQEGDVFDPEKGLAMAISKKALGNKGNFNEVFKKWLPKETSLEKALTNVRNAVKKCMAGLTIPPITINKGRTRLEHYIYGGKEDAEN